MDRREAVRRLKEHFAIHDDGRPTPYLDEAEQLAYDALERYDLILKKFGSFENVMGVAMIIETYIADKYDMLDLVVQMLDEKIKEYKERED